MSSTSRRWRQLQRRLGLRPPLPRATSPDAYGPAGLDAAWAPGVLRRQQAVDRAEGQLLDARSTDPHRPLAELLPLAKVLHEARLEHAAALLAAGGEVPEGLRDELELRAPRGVRQPPVPRSVRARI